MVTVTNNNPYSVSFEAKLGLGTLRGFSTRVGKKNGAWIWAVAVPTQGRVALNFRETN